ncbi:RAB6-interacting golgin [Actinidia rufa]|uniref:RAB6-interacting golgin n=1 Tax=Actinidia rufa TaxID=165716 RepID=A0A7J0G5F5_9ERIC|nr:RAB6-interacting golgin [Actinidia rufa]
MKNQGNSSHGDSGRLSTDNEEEFTKVAMASFQAREEEIERRKMEVRERVEMQLGRAEEETRRLAQIWEELDVLTDPMRKEVAIVRKRIDMVNRDLKSLGQSCQKKEKEYKEALEAFNEKSNEKAHLTSTLMEMVNDSEKMRMKKLEELSKILDPTN